MGCPVGIGPEIILKLFAAGSAFSLNETPVVVGDPAVLQHCGQILQIGTNIVRWYPGKKVKAGTLPVYKPENFPVLAPESLAWGKPDVRTGTAMARCIEAAVSLVQGNECSGMVTCPITKKALNEAGYSFPGHTEMLASLCHSRDYAMMMAGKKLRVTLVTIHTALNRVSASLTKEKILGLIEMTSLSLQRDFGIAAPRLAVAALNPHAGEDGLFGDEEELLIGPAIRQACESGLPASGPYPPDTVFNKAAAGDFDAVVCMYHDQGLIPFKLLHFADGVNVTIGLPIVRTSVDHGTAYDIAGTGKADTSSLAAAVAMAGQIVENRSR